MCSVGSDSIWNYQWYKDRNDNVVSQSERHTITGDTLTINGATVNEGPYWCQGKRESRPTSSSISEPVTITVNALPVASVSVSPQGLLYSGETVSLQCVIPGYTDWRYYWYKNNRHLLSQTSKAIDITIPITLTGQAGQYRCEGLRTDRPQRSQPSDDITISVTALPKATLTVKPNPVFPGETVTLMCSVGSDSRWIYQWYKDRNDNVLSQSGYSNIGVSHISRAAVSDQGQYWCEGIRVSRPTSSQTSDPVTLTVKALPTASVKIVTPQGLLYPGETVTLQCDISDYTDWRYYWYKNNQHLPEETSKVIDIIIHTTQTGLVGQYRCEGTRTDQPQRSQPSDDITISVTALPKATLTVEPNPVFPGETVTLTCSVGSDSIWNYQWYNDRNDNVVSQSGYSNIGVSHISRAGVSDQGQYWCEGSRVSRPTSSQPSGSVTLTVKALPTASVKIVTPQGLLYPGETVTLQCDISDYTDWTYHWFRYKEELPIQTRKTITISLPDQAGQYKCVGRKKGRPQKSNLSSALPIIITALPKTTLTVKPNTVYTGETVTLTCSVRYDSIWNYQRYKDWNYNVVSQSVRHTITGDTFTIRRAAVSDQGPYWCEGNRVSRPTSSQPSNAITLNVKDYQPKTTLTSDKENIFTGDRVTLSCTVESSGWKFYWYRHRPDSTPVTTTSGYSYTLSWVSVSDGGQYWCRAGRGDPVYYTLYSDPVQINVTERPVAVLVLQPNWTQIFIRETVTMRCDIQGGGDSDWNYRWYKNSQLVIPFNTKPEYRISPVYKSNSGSYTCVGVKGNKFSKISEAVKLIVSGKSI
ncbi:basement membrane-specific heparan sulfate proteoglycan core protein-like [Salvelinus fontinalis]|uniref:basement membrane-specific heparan sulfate proteoglycan core protein-like n=1 Tax=Salvelinus fontinalis TaxID=8038 RepID=UPI0024866B56|nr:basement membrane-specific heparan sulfate proteoglycan core protein-like [Salvelinus fontinalis]